MSGFIRGYSTYLNARVAFYRSQGVDYTHAKSMHVFHPCATHSRSQRRRQRLCQDAAGAGLA